MGKFEGGLGTLPSPSRLDLFFAMLVTAIYAICVLMVVSHHVPWRDEADVWLAARDLPVGEFWGWLGAAGTTGLWYIVVKLLVLLGLPYQSMLFVHAALAIMVAFLIALAAPFPRPFKVLLIFSYFTFYEFAIVARSYVLSNLLLVLMAIVLTARLTRYWLLGVLLFLLFNANTQSFFIAGIISFFLVARITLARAWSRDAWIGAAIALCGGVLAFLQLCSNGHTTAPYDGHPHWQVAVNFLTQAFLPHVQRFFADDLHSNHGTRRLLVYLAYLCVHVATLLILCSALFLMRRSPWAIGIVALSYCVCLYIGVFKWYGGDRHAGVWFMTLIFGLWISWPPPGVDEADRPAIRFFSRFSYRAMLAGLLVSCGTGINWAYHDLTDVYSGAKEAAEFLRKPEFAAIPFACDSGTAAESVLPYLPGRTIWYSGRQEFGTCTDWRRDWIGESRLSPAEALERVHLKFHAERHLLIIVAQAPLVTLAGRYRLIFKNSSHAWGHPEETYYIYLDDGQ